MLLDDGQQLELRSCLRILVADDDETSRQVILLLLERLGFRARAATNGREAVSSVASTPVDVIFMDVQMPELDGIEATREIREKVPDREVSIIGLTASALDRDRQRCLDAGMNDCLSKPLRADQLEDLLSGLMSQLGPGLVARRAAPVSDDPLVQLREMTPRAIFVDIIERFLTSADEHCAQLREAVAGGDIRAAGREAHSLRGKSLSLGVNGVARMCERLEKLAPTGITEELLRLLDELEPELGRAREVLEREMAE